MADEIVVIVEPPLPEVAVELDGGGPAQNVVLSETGLVGPKGDKGDPGETDLAAINAHIVSEEPHPVYDDGPSFALLYENAKV